MSASNVFSVAEILGIGTPSTQPLPADNPSGPLFVEQAAAGSRVGLTGSDGRPEVNNDWDAYRLSDLLASSVRTS